MENSLDNLDQPLLDSNCSYVLYTKNPGEDEVKLNHAFNSLEDVGHILYAVLKTNMLVDSVMSSLTPEESKALQTFLKTIDRISGENKDLPVVSPLSMSKLG